MSVADVREFEQSLVEKGTSLAELMRRAGSVVAVQAARLVHRGSVVVLCGMGNNGGDGWVAADNLARHGYEVSVVAPATPAVMKSELARRVATRTAEMGVPVHVAPSPEELEELLVPADVVIDACFGIGFHGEMPEPYATWAAVVDEVFTGRLVSVDVPSGIDATSGMAAGPYFEADVTVTMFAAKPGLVSGVGRGAAGRIVVASLVEDDDGLQDISDAAAAFVLEERDYLDVLPEPDPLQDKYTRGRVLVVAGSTRYPGAAVMAALAAARSGAGYVTLAVPAPVVPIAQMHLLSIPVAPLPADPEGAFSVEAADRVGELLGHADVVLAGPGMTTSLGACEVVRNLLRSDRPLVLDADALNAVVRICAGSAEAHPDALRREAPLVLTPHRRELARLMGGEIERTATLAGAMDAAQDLAWAVGSSDFCVVAKGPVSAVATIDSTLIPQPGPIALATAGTGDVLAGITASLLAQLMVSMDEEERAEGLDSSDLLMLAAGADRVHAIAGELACRTRGSRGVIAPDVAEVAGKAIDELLRRAERDFDASEEDPGTVLEGDAALGDEDRAGAVDSGAAGSNVAAGMGGTGAAGADGPVGVAAGVGIEGRADLTSELRGAGAGERVGAGAAAGAGAVARADVTGERVGAGSGIGMPADVTGELEPIKAQAAADENGASKVERTADRIASGAVDEAELSEALRGAEPSAGRGESGVGRTSEADRAAGRAVKGADGSAASEAGEDDDTDGAGRIDETAKRRAAVARRRAENALALEAALVEADDSELEEPLPEHERLERRPAPAKPSWDAQNSQAAPAASADARKVDEAGRAADNASADASETTEEEVACESVKTADAPAASADASAAPVTANAEQSARAANASAGETTVLPAISSDTATAQDADNAGLSRAAMPAEAETPALTAPEAPAATGELSPSAPEMATAFKTALAAPTAPKAAESTAFGVGEPVPTDSEAPAATGAFSPVAPETSVPAVPASSARQVPASDVTHAAAVDTPERPVEAASDAALPPFLARMAAFVAEGSVPNGETGAFAAVAAAVEAPVAPDSKAPSAPEAGTPALAVSPVPTASRLPAFLSAALSGRPIGRSIDPQTDGAADVPATFDATIEIAPPPTVLTDGRVPGEGSTDEPAPHPASTRPLKRGRSTTTSPLGLPKKKPNPVEAFHERATLRIGEKPAVPPDQRPSASKPAKGKTKPKRGKRS